MKGKVWVAFSNSTPVRALRNSPAAARVAESTLFRRLDVTRRRVAARRAVRRDPLVLDELGTVCLFVGHVKSGGTLLGAMIDAHPDAVIADEVDVLAQLAAGFRRDELLHTLIRNARHEALKGRVTARRLGGYSLAVPGQWQGRFRQIRVIGESRAGPTTRRLEDPRLLDELRRFASPARLRFIHVVRSPLDPIGAMVRRGNRTFEDAYADYAAQSGRLEQIRSWLDDDEIHTVHYADLVESPSHILGEALDFLGLERVDEHLAACGRLIDPAWSGERRHLDWQSDRLERIQTLAASHEFLARYADRAELGPVSP